MWFVENYDEKASLGLKVKHKLHEEQSPFQKIEIYETEFFGNLLTLDGLVMLTEKDEFVYHEMITHMPLCTLKNPERVLVVGGGDGGAIREILKHPSIKEAVLCEIDERVTRLSQKYFPSVSCELENPKVKMHFEDGFKFLDKYENYFDLIITDSSDPVGPGVALFKEDYYRLVKKALKPDGIMVSQSESPWYFEDTMNSMTSAMSSVFKHVETYIALVTLYPSGFWTITAASDAHSLHNFDEKRSAEIAKTCKYYNPELHKGALALPNFVKKIVANK
ncbi:MAG TPA: polyamine aminopropyltransferase [bacterium]|jgi:spermidine synthase|nr:polyamine aminopropyltransferase [bacterium]HQO92515.1 polyamine aminopropyltransferase [bacterium]